MFLRLVLFVNYPYLMVRIKISELLASQSFSGYCVISSLTLGGLFRAFILVIDESWGQRRIRGSLLLFLHFLIFIVLFSVLPGFRGCTAGSLCVPEP